MTLKIKSAFEEMRKRDHKIKKQLKELKRVFRRLGGKRRKMIMALINACEK